MSDKKDDEKEEVQAWQREVDLISSLKRIGPMSRFSTN